MQEPKLYLKQNVQCEPLFNQWYAWTSRGIISERLFGHKECVYA